MKEGGKGMDEVFNEKQGVNGFAGFEMNIESLLDITVEVTVEIGRTHIPIGSLLSLSKGSVIELDKVAGEAVDIYVNEKLLGKGEIVVVNERLGVRMTEIITPKERVQRLG
jgi:flagellar motor switch protein FliN/FliY